MSNNLNSSMRAGSAQDRVAALGHATRLSRSFGNERDISSAINKRIK